MVAFSPDGSTTAFCREHMAAIIGIDGWMRSPRVLATHVADARIKRCGFLRDGCCARGGRRHDGQVLRRRDRPTGNEIEYGVDIYSVAFSPRGMWRWAVKTGSSHFMMHLRANCDVS